MAVGNRKQYVLVQMMTQDDRPFGLACRTATPAFARKRKEIFMTTVRAADSGKSLLEVSTSQISPNHR